MRLPSRSVLALFVAACAAAAGCDVPTDQSAGMYVSIASPAPVLLRGAVTEVEARVWVRTEDGDSTEVRNAELIWSTSDPLLATISPAGATVGRVTGVNSGMVTIRAIAPGFESAEPGVLALRVSNPLEIDSISPDTVRYGQLLVAYGVGVGQLFFAGLGNGTLGIDSLAVAGDPTGIGARAFWVAYPASTGFLFAAGSGQLVAAPESTVVQQVDIFEPNQASPTTIALDGDAPYPGAPWLRFYNPALAFEDLRGDTFGYDWYRWTTANPSEPYVFLFVAPALRGTNATYLTDDAGTTTANSWRVGPGNYDCKGYQFRPRVAPSDSVLVSLLRLPAGSVDMISAYAQQGRYILAVVAAGEVDRRFPPDRFEENDLCDFADENFADAARHIDLSAEFRETLTIDTPHEVDWLRFRVPGTIAQSVTVRTTAFTFGKGDRSDIDTYVLRVPVDARGLEAVGGSTEPGSTGSATMLLDPGDYYLAVVDSVGMPVHYGVCIATGSTCTLPSAPAEPAPSAQTQPLRIPGLSAIPSRSRSASAAPWR